MKIKGLKRICSGIKILRRKIKEERIARLPETLALKRQEAKNYVAAIPEETWNKLSKSVFQQKGESRSLLLEKLHNYKKLCDENGLEMPQDVLGAYNKLEYKAAIFGDRMAIAKSKGKTPQNACNFGDKFRANNKEELEKLNSFYKQQLESATQKCHDMVFSGKPYDQKAYEKLRTQTDQLIKNAPDLGSIANSDLYNQKISEVAENIITKGQTFYHGTKHQHSISKTGFHLLPKQNQAATCSRELGEGVYLTPDKTVASWFAGMRGGIIPVKVDTKKVAVVNNDQLSNLTQEIATQLDQQQITNPATMELVVKNLFQRNGYNAVYTKESLGMGLYSKPKFVDALVGGKQSQLVVFDPNDIKILDKTVKDRIDNQRLQIGTIIGTPKRILQYVKKERSS